MKQIILLTFIIFLFFNILNAQKINNDTIIQKDTIIYNEYTLKNRQFIIDVKEEKKIALKKIIKSKFGFSFGFSLPVIFSYKNNLNWLKPTSGWNMNAFIYYENIGLGINSLLFDIKLLKDLSYNNQIYTNQAVFRIYQDKYILNYSINFPKKISFIPKIGYTKFRINFALNETNGYLNINDYLKLYGFYTGFNIYKFFKIKNRFSFFAIYYTFDYSFIYLNKINTDFNNSYFSMSIGLAFKLFGFYEKYK